MDQLLFGVVEMTTEAPARHKMDGQMDLAEVANALKEAPLVAAWLAIERSRTENLVRRIAVDVVPGAMCPERQWPYDQLELRSGLVAGAVAADWFDPDHTHGEYGKDLRFKLPSYRSVANWRRNPSRSTWSGSALPVPYLSLDVSIDQTSNTNWNQMGPLISDEAPSFFDVEPAIAEFFEGRWDPIYRTVPRADEARIRFGIMTAWIEAAHIAPTHVSVTVNGNSVAGCRLELIVSAGHQQVRLPGPGTVDIPTPDGLPQRALLVLSQGGAWLDHRYLDTVSTEGVTREPPPLPDRIASLAAQGEGPTIEYKVQLPVAQEERKKLAASVAAFANGSGGALLYGVENKTLDVVGIEPSQEAVDGLYHVIRDRVDPQPKFEVHVVEVNGRDLIAVVVEPGELKPYGLNRDALDVYVRRGANTVRARRDDFREIQQSSQADPAGRLPGSYGLPIGR